MRGQFERSVTGASKVRGSPVVSVSKKRKVSWLMVDGCWFGEAFPEEGLFYPDMVAGGFVVTDGGHGGGWAGPVFPAVQAVAFDVDDAGGFAGAGCCFFG